MKSKLVKKIEYELTGRNLELAKQYYSVQAAYQGTWCKLFNTDNYKKSLIHISKVKQVFDRRVKTLLIEAGHTNANFANWYVKMTGNMSRVKVAMKQEQSYRIIVVPRTEDYEQLHSIIREKPWLVIDASIKDESLLKIALESCPSIIEKIPNPSKELKEHAIFHKMKIG